MRTPVTWLPTSDAMPVSGDVMRPQNGSEVPPFTLLWISFLYNVEQKFSCASYKYLYLFNFFARSNWVLFWSSHSGRNPVRPRKQKLLKTRKDIWKVTNNKKNENSKRHSWLWKQEQGAMLWPHSFISEGDGFFGMILQFKFLGLPSSPLLP